MTEEALAKSRLPVPLLQGVTLARFVMDLSELDGKIWEKVRTKVRERRKCSQVTSLSIIESDRQRMGRQVCEKDIRND